MEKKPKKQKVSESYFTEFETEENGMLRLHHKYEEGSTNPRGPVQLNEQDKFPDIQILGDRKLTCSLKNVGYSLIRATHCIHSGSFFYEVKIEDKIQDNAHFRIGWSRRPAKHSFPCGYDQFSYSYRDSEGDVFHDGYSHPYGEKYKSGDVIGCFLHLPPYEITNVKQKREEFHEYGVPCEFIEDQPPLVPLSGSYMKFYINGKDQGIAFKDIYAGKYYPTISLYMGASVTLEFNNFKFPPKDVEYDKIPETV